MTATMSPKRARKPLHRLRCQRNLRDEHDRATTGLERGLDSLQVHLGLARSGDPVEQELPPIRRSAAAAKRLVDTSERGLLLPGQCERHGARCADVVARRHPPARALGDRDQAPSLEAA